MQFMSVHCFVLSWIAARQARAPECAPTPATYGRKELREPIMGSHSSTCSSYANSHSDCNRADESIRSQRTPQLQRAQHHCCGRSYHVRVEAQPLCFGSGRGHSVLVYGVGAWRAPPPRRVHRRACELHSCARVAPWRMHAANRSRLGRVVPNRTEPGHIRP